MNKLERLLNNLSSTIQNVEKRRYTANQMLRVEDVNLAEGSSLTINMNNLFCTQEIILECLEIVRELKPYLPMKKVRGLDGCLNHYKNALLTKALQESEGNKAKAAELLGMTHRQIRYEISKKEAL